MSAGIINYTFEKAKSYHLLIFFFVILIKFRKYFFKISVTYKAH